MGEAIGLRVGQFIFSEGMLVVDGFIKDFERIRTNYNKKGLAEKWFSRVLIEAGVEKVDRKLTPHSLHSTYVTRMRRNESGETVKKLAGHSTIAMTDYYTRISIPEMVKSLQPTKEAANRLFE